jgi:hypothetical protein
LDFLFEDALLRLPHYTFTEEDYRATGEIDFGLALRKWATATGLDRKRSWILNVGGMWGGYPSIRSAKDFLRAMLLNSRDALRNVHQVNSLLIPGKLFVAVHLRTTGDGFTIPANDESVRGKFNIIIPGEWYLWVCEQLQNHFRDRIQFRIFTDRKNSLFNEAVSRFNPGQVEQTGLTECSDLLLMSQADVRVCSVSSFSLAASFLSGGPYLWYEPQLNLSQGHYTLWGDSGTQMPVTPHSSWKLPDIASVSERGTKIEKTSSLFLGTAMNIGDPLPEPLVRLLENKLKSHDPQTNLLEFGCLPVDLKSNSLTQVVGS